jgi:hypothetical protein
MIQRIQSLLLLGVVILLTINLFVPVWANGELSSSAISNNITLDVYKIEHETNNTVIASKNVYYLAGLLIANIVLALYTIFQYKNRPLQITLCSVLTLLILAVIGGYFMSISAARSMITATSEGSYKIGYFLPILASVLILGARYFIRKDEELVKSVDRIR